MAWTNTGSGGGQEEVGTPGKSMELLSFDEKTRPITRYDILKFTLDENNTSDHEKKIIQNSMLYGISGSAAGFFAGWQLSRLLPFRWLERKKVAPFKNFGKFGRFCFAVTGASIPFLMVQQWCVSEVLKLDEHKSVLAFHLKRLLITQRSSLLFSRSQVREVTKEEQSQLAQQNVTIRQQESKSIGGTGKSMDVDLAMQQMTLTPVAQSGYQAPPSSRK